MNDHLLDPTVPVRNPATVHASRKAVWRKGLPVSSSPNAEKAVTASQTRRCSQPGGDTGGPLSATLSAPSAALSTRSAYCDITSLRIPTTIPAALSNDTGIPMIITVPARAHSDLMPGSTRRNGQPEGGASMHRHYAGSSPLSVTDPSIGGRGAPPRAAVHRREAASE